MDLITAHSGEFPEHDFGDSGVVIYPYRWGRTKSFFRRMLKRVDFILWVLRTCWAKHYKCLIGIDPDGLIVASLAGALLRSPVIYYSLELYLSADNPGIKQRFKKALERFCNQKAVWTIIQDTNRAACLVGDNRIDAARILIVPNSPLGQAKITQRDYWHRKFGLRPEQKVILQAGGISDSYSYIREHRSRRRMLRHAIWCFLCALRCYVNSIGDPNDSQIKKKADAWYWYGRGQHQLPVALSSKLCRHVL